MIGRAIYIGPFVKIRVVAGTVKQFDLVVYASTDQFIFDQHGRSRIDRVPALCCRNGIATGSDLEVPVDYTDVNRVKLLIRVRVLIRDIDLVHKSLVRSNVYTVNIPVPIRVYGRRLPAGHASPAVIRFC